MKVIIPENVTSLKEVKMCHPRTEESVSFLISDDGVYEPRVYSQEIGSFFIGDTVDPDTSITYLTKVDELFLILPSLLKHRKQFRSLSDILPEDNSLSEIKYEKILPIITDIKDVDDTNYFRYSEEKVKDWLKNKISAVSQVVLEKRMNFSLTSSGLMALKKKDVSLEDPELQRYSFRLVADYLSDETSKDFAEILGIKDQEAEEVTSDNGEGDVIVLESSANKSSKPKEDYYKSPTKEEKNQGKKVLTRAQKTLAKVDKTGMKSLNSYFSKRKD